MNENAKDRGKKSSNGASLRLSGRHKIQTFGVNDGGLNLIRRRCHVCYNGPLKKAVKTKYGCLDCDKALCMDPCWNIYHFDDKACNCCV